MVTDENYLGGLRVVDLTRLLPGPFATMLLADMGAEVIKVEDPKVGDYARYYPPLVNGSSAFFQSVNRNKKCITLNLKAARGRELLGEVLAGADVVIESFRPGVMARLGWAPEVLRERFPRLVVASLTGFGQTGPKAQNAGHDMNFLALSGVLHGNGEASGPPQVPGFQLADLAGGALYAALGITSALLRRERTGQGAWLDISMTEGALSFMIPQVARHSAGVEETRGRGFLTGGLPGYRVYRTAEGEHLAVAALEPKFWDPLVAALGLPELKGKGMLEGPAGEAVAEAVQAVLEAETRATWEQRLGGLDVCVEPVLTMEEVLEAEIHKARQVFFELQGIRQVRTPLTPANREHCAAGSAGSDNEAIFGELGLEGAELRELRKAGVI